MGGRNLKPRVPLHKKISDLVTSLDNLPKSRFSDLDLVAFNHIKSIIFGSMVGRLTEKHLKILRRISGNVYAEQKRERKAG